MLSPTSTLLTLASAAHGAERFQGPRAEPIKALIASFPNPRQVTLAEAATTLASVSSPIVAGMLPSEDFLRFWEIASLPEPARTRCERQRQNFIQWFEDRAVQFQLKTTDPIVLPTGTEILTLPWSDVREWVGAVAMFTVGSTLVRNNGGIYLALIATDGTRNFVPGPDFDGCSHEH
jgi:hypothetical protein